MRQLSTTLVTFLLLWIIIQTVHDSTYGLELGTRRSIGTSSQIIESTAKIEISPESVILKGSVFMKYGDDNTILLPLGMMAQSTWDTVGLEVGTGNLLEISGNVNIRENHDLYVSGSTSISGDLTIGSSSINVESQLGLLDDSISLLEDDISGLDASVNALETITTDISYASGTTTILNDLDVSGDVFMSSGLIVNGSGNFKGSTNFEQNVRLGSDSSDVSLVLHGNFKIKSGGNLIIEDSSFSITEIHTDVKITDILDISNDGTGPALIVRQYDKFPRYCSIHGRR